MKRVIIMGCLGCWWFPQLAGAVDLFSQSVLSIEEGNELYRKKNFEQALEQYERAEQIHIQEPRVNFNRGNALYKLGYFKAAREAYFRSLSVQDPGLKKKVYYNIGNTFLAGGAYLDAMSYYRRSLEIDVGFDDARFNLEIALQALKLQKQNQDHRKDKESDRSNTREHEGEEHETASQANHLAFEPA